MSVFAVMLFEHVVQVGDKTRLDCSKSFRTIDSISITKIECQPETSDVFHDITSNGNWLDWVYSTAGTKTATVRVTAQKGNQTPTVHTTSYQLTVLTAGQDRLFSSDFDLTAWEPGILNYVRDGRTSYLDVHREAQRQILDWLDAHEIRDVNGDRLTASAIVDVQEVKEWSKFMVLQIIFEGLSNAVDDVFDRKAKKYEAMANTARNRAQVKLDLNGDGTADNSERVRMTTVRLVRR